MKGLRLLIILLISISSLIFFASLNNLENNITVPKESGAKKALNFWTQIRAYPEKDIPKEKFFKAYQKEKLKMNKANNINMDVESWEAMGPLNVPGRMISVAVNPQNSSTLYTGAATGGLWRTYSSSNGNGWHRVTTGFPTLGVMAITIDPTDTLKMLIGTGETYGVSQSLGGYVIRTTRGSYGMGILKTTDGGVTWSKSLDWTFDQRRGIQDIELDPVNSNIVFAATSIGIYRSLDGGDNWSEVYSVEMAQDIVIHTSDPNKILVSTGNLGSPDAGIYRSLDGGDTWSKVNGIPFYTGKTLMDIYQADPNIVFASVADSLNGKGLYKTTNFGDSWTKINSTDVPSYQGFFAHWVAVHPSDQNRIVQAGVQIYKSFNGGTSLSVVGGPHVDHHNYTHDPNNENILYIACDGGVYRSANFGTSYTNIGTGLQTCQFYNGFSSSYSDSNLAMGGLQDNNTIIYEGTMNWRRVIGGDGSWSAINSLNDNVMYGSWQRGNILKSVNRGNSFSGVTSGLYGEAAFIAPYVISESNPSILYAGFTRVFKTENSADSWSSVSNDLDGNQILSMVVANKNPDLVYAATAPIYTRGHIFRTKNGGDTWDDVTYDLPDRYLMDIAIDPIDQNTVYVVFGGYGTGHVYKSTNSGITWSDITGNLSDVPTLALAIDPLNSDYVYVGSDLGVFVSSDGGSSWNSFSEGLPEAVMGMDLNISRANRSLWVATHGNGAYRRPLLYTPDFYLSINMIDLPTSVLKGTELTFEASVRNAGESTQTEDYSIEARVLDPSGTEVYSSTQVFCCLEAGETTNITFEGSLTFDQVGEYNFELITIGNTQLPGNDTLSQSINVIEPAAIANSTVEKIFKTYEEINDGSTFNGDDVQKSINLPFNFIYDNFEYDKIQMSTNGWLEFGKGSDGTERGLSLAAQLGAVGANENGRLGGTARPNKALGPWWEDLNADANGKVRYETLGETPNRIFICQWEDMRAYWDAGATTTRVNFQVRLYEGSNKIEFCYGDVIPGTFGGGDIGAAIGFKDFIGGDYRFYDIAAGGAVSMSEHITNLSPLVNWPGKDNAFVIHTSITDVNDPDDFVPENFILYQNYPNPFNPVTTIKFSLPVKSDVSLKIFDILGNEVETIINEKLSAGNHEVKFNAAKLASGVYVYRIKAGKFIDGKKLILLK